MSGISILDSTKKALGIAADYTDFDPDIIMFINAVFSTLNQLSVGPDDGFSISDNSTAWVDYYSDANINNVQSYMYMRVKLMFDPPATSFALDALNAQIKELEWRINVYQEGVKHPHNSPNTDSGVSDDIVDDVLYDVTGDKDFPPEAPLGARGIDTATGIIYEKS